MNDDTERFDSVERRLRDALAGASLPSAPDTLRDSLVAITAAAAVPPRVIVRQRWLRLMPAIAAVVVVAVAVGMVSGGLGRLGSTPTVGPTAVTSAAPSAAPAGPSETPSAAANAGQRVYSMPELEAALIANRDALVGKIVLVDGELGQAPEGPCSTPAPGCPVGTLSGTSEDVVGTLYTASLLSMAPAVAPNGVMAMRVLPTGLEYLGGMGSAGGSDFQVSIDTLRQDWQHNAPLLTFIVTGWLGTSGPLPCPATPGSPPPADTPFGNGCPSSWLATTNDAHPADAVPVQYSAYDDFGPGATAGSTDPKLGSYLVRLVVDLRQGVNGARGWQIVGRLSRAPAAPGQNGVGVPLFDPAGLQSALQADRASYLGRVVAVKGTISALGVTPPCLNVNSTAWSVCGMALLDGTSESVSYDGVTGAVLRQVRAVDRPLDGTLVFRVRENDLAFLGFLGATTNATVDDLRQPKAAADAMTVYVVSGWLVATPTMFCPAESTEAVDTPFGQCERAWLTANPESQKTAAATNDGLRVQWSAYRQYAPDPSTRAEPQPRFGTYLVRLIQDTTSGASGALGWQVVARLAP